MQNSFEITSDFTKYKQAFLAQNAKHNLISKNDENFLYEKHIYDSLAIKLFFDKYNILSGNILDIGCGGGFPCLPIAIECSSFNILGVDSIRKKIDSVQTIANKLNLKNIEILSLFILEERFSIIFSENTVSTVSHNILLIYINGRASI